MYELKSFDTHRCFLPHSLGVVYSSTDEPALRWYAKFCSWSEVAPKLIKVSVFLILKWFKWLQVSPLLTYLLSKQTRRFKQHTTTDDLRWPWMTVSLFVSTVCLWGVCIVIIRIARYLCGNCAPCSYHCVVIGIVNFYQSVSCCGLHGRLWPPKCQRGQVFRRNCHPLFSCTG